jgi:hypothetical protein
MSSPAQQEPRPAGGTKTPSDFNSTFLAEAQSRTDDYSKEIFMWPKFALHDDIPTKIRDRPSGIGTPTKLGHKGH